MQTTLSWRSIAYFLKDFAPAAEAQNEACGLGSACVRRMPRRWYAPFGRASLRVEERRADRRETRRATRELARPALKRAALGAIARGVWRCDVGCRRRWLTPPKLFVGLVRMSGPCAARLALNGGGQRFVGTFRPRTRGYAVYRSSAGRYTERCGEARPSICRSTRSQRFER
jgi:hypothetical protein